MSTPIVYPASLPTPQTMPIQSDERRALSNGRPFQARALQRDFLATVQIAFPPMMDLTKATELKRWWEDDLEFGGNLFAATWPLPQGRVPAVYGWLGPLRFDNESNRYWRVTGAAEVRGVGQLPVKLEAPIFLLHFDNNLTDVSGHLFEADTIISDAAPNSFGYTTDALFGSHAGRCPGTNNHIRSEPFPDLQLASFDFQLEGFVKPRNLFSAVGGAVICTGSLQSGGASVGPDPEAGQIAIEISTLGDWIVEYSDALGSDNPIELSDPACAQEEWNYFRLENDATSLRFYAGPVVGGTAPKIMETMGVRPYAGAYDSLQRFFIAARYAGGVPPLEVYTNRFHGDFDEFRFLGFLTGDGGGPTVPIPTSRFSDQGA